MYKETKLYLILLAIIGFMEVVLAIPLVIDSFIHHSYGSSVLLVLLGLHLFSYMLVNTGLVEYYSKLTHIFGIVGFLISYLPFIGFLPHLILAVKIFYDFKDTNKKYSKELEQRLDKQEESEEGDWL